MHDKKILCYLILMPLLLTLWGCGSSADSGPPTVSGVAAKGAPLSGTVTLKDKNGIQRGPVAADLDGKFSFDVTGLVQPFILKAEYTTNYGTYPLFSIAPGAGIANINPLTDLILWLALGSDPAPAFANQSSVQETRLSKTSIAAAQLSVQTKLAPLLEKYGVTAFAPLDAPYSATPDNRLDAMLDIVSISASYGIFLIGNHLESLNMAGGSLADFATTPLDLSKAPDSAVLTDIQDITTMLASLRTTMNLGAGLTLSALENFYVPEATYRTGSGNTRAADMVSVIAVFGPGGSNTNGSLKSIRNVRLLSDLTAAYVGRGVDRVYLLNYDFIHNNGLLVHGQNVTLSKEVATGKWRFIGSPPGGDGNSGVVITQYGLGGLP